jgi:hypothetical protein
MADRGLWVAAGFPRLNVQRLMYQSLIFAAVAGDEARRLRPPLDSEDLKRLADALVDGMWRNLQLRGDFLGRQMLVDQAQAIELAGRQPRHALCDRMFFRRTFIPIRGTSHVSLFLQRKPPHHAALPSNESFRHLMSICVKSPLF